MNSDAQRTHGKLLACLCCELLFVIILFSLDKLFALRNLAGVLAIKRCADFVV